MSGWTNYSGMVIRYKINESWMGNRVSKSIFKLLYIVKEQRVYGSYLLYNKLRCTLTALEKGYQVKILSNLNNCHNTHPYFITGFINAEGSFIITFNKWWFKYYNK